MSKKCKMFEDSKKVVSSALIALDKKNLAFIAHANSFPSEPCEDTGFGNINSIGAKRLMDFTSGVFNAIQLGPYGKTKSCDASPYTGTIFSGNPLFIDLQQLTQEIWGNILSDETFCKIVENNPKKNLNKAAYTYIYKEQEEALKEAFENFKKKKLFKKEFEKFVKENSFWLENDSLYEALSIENGNDYWPQWKNEVDKTLSDPKDKKVAQERKNEIEKKYKNEIEFYKFCQFVLAEQSKQTREYAKKQNIKMIADRQVAFSDRDSWAYQAYFLKGWSLGCPPDYFSEDGQAWGFPVVDPEQLFNKDCSLGPAGKLLKELYKKMFTENPGGVRIDHMVGLIDPWVYKSNKKPKIEEGAGRLYSSPQHEFLKKYSIATLDDVNNEVEPDKEKWIKKLTGEQVEKYGAFVEKIVIAAAKECGLDSDAIVAEDLGTLTYPVESVMKKFALQGMKLVQFVVAEEPEHPYRAKNITENSWAMVGTHDNEPIRVWAKSIVNTDKAVPHANNLAEDIFSYENDMELIKHKLRTDAEFLTEAKLIEIFASPAQNVQVFFTDFFGMLDTYNRPGTSGDCNWTLRIPSDFECYYEDNFKKGLAMNLPKILSKAIKARGEDFVKKNSELLKSLENLI